MMGLNSIDPFPSNLLGNRFATPCFGQTHTSIICKRATKKYLLYFPFYFLARERSPSTFREHLLICKFILHMWVYQHYVSILPYFKSAFGLQTKYTGRMHNAAFH